MVKAITIFLFSAVIISCTSTGKVNSGSEIPVCLATKIKTMIANPQQGSPLSVTRYRYKGQIVYYMVSPCCDKYNIVYDKNCNVMGYPDGGYTGKGDGNMTDFKNSATDEKIVWQLNNEKTIKEDN